MKNISVKITVIIPVYNSAKYLGKCLDSILNQTYSNWEAIIIDDASTDESFEILKRYSSVDKRFEIHQHKENKGPGITRNEGIQYASKNISHTNKERNYIVYIDSDDWIDINYFESIVDLVNIDNSDVIFVDVVQEDENGRYIKDQKMSVYKDEKKDKILRHQMTGKIPWGGVRKVVNSRLIIDNNIQYTNDIIGEEAIYSFKVLFYAEKISFNKDSLYHYIVRSDSQSSSYDENPYGDVCQKLEVLLKEMDIYDEYKDTHSSFAFTALVVSIYRMTRYHGFKKTIKFTEVALLEFQKSYGFDLDKDSLENRVRFLLPFAKHSLVIFIVLISKIKSVLSDKI